MVEWGDRVVAAAYQRENDRATLLQSRPVGVLSRQSGPRTMPIEHDDLWVEPASICAHLYGRGLVTCDGGSNYPLTEPLSSCQRCWPGAAAKSHKELSIAWSVHLTLGLLLLLFGLGQSFLSSWLSSTTTGSRAIRLAFPD